MNLEKLFRIILIITMLVMGYIVIEKDRTPEEELKQVIQHMQDSRFGELSTSHIEHIEDGEKQDKEFLVFYPEDTKVTIKVGEKVIYYYDTNDKGLTAEIESSEEMLTKGEADDAYQIEIQIEDMANKKVDTIAFYRGDLSEIIKVIVEKSVLEIVLTITFFIIGTGLMLYYFKAKKNNVWLKRTMKVKYLAYITFVLGAWRFSEIEMARYIFPKSAMWAILSILLTAVIPLGFALFLRVIDIKEGNEVWTWLCKVNLGVILLQGALQILQIQELRQTLWMTYMVIIAELIWLSYKVIQELMQAKKIKHMGLNIFTFISGMVGSALSIIILQATGETKSMISLIFLMYVSILAYENIKKMRQQELQQSQMEEYRYLAFTDQMSGHYNRSAFERDINQLNEWYRQGMIPFQNVGVIVMDLNGLKACNDKYGHQQGDTYIKTISYIILQVFDETQKCYRIGGDEFCVVMLQTTQKEIEEKIQTLQNKVQQVNALEKEIHYDVAVGYALYEEGVDHEIEDMVKRADHKMYKHKATCKQP